jgi:hypothetical protein
MGHDCICCPYFYLPRDIWSAAANNTQLPCATISCYFNATFTTVTSYTDLIRY